MRQNLPKTRRLSGADLREHLDQRTRELDEGLEQQAATSEVVLIISRARGDLQPVFAAMLEHAARICDANFGKYLWLQQ